MTALKRHWIVALFVPVIAALLAPTLPTTHAEEAVSKGWQAVSPGRVEPWSGEVRIGSPAAGRIGEVLVKVNDTVFAGEAMIRIDDDEVRTRHAKAELQVRLRQRARPKLDPKADPKVAERRKREDAAFDAERAVIAARQAVDRAAAARRAGTGDDQAVSAARKALANAREQLRARQDELARFEAEAPPTLPTELEGQFAMARVDLRGAEAALDALTIRAPIAGTVLQINVRAGELASPAAPQPLIVVGDISKLRVRAEIDERDYGAIKLGHAVVVRSGAFPGREVAGTVSSIAPIVEGGRIGARGGRNLTDVNVAEVVIDLAEAGPLAVGMKVDVFFRRQDAKR